MKTSQNTNSFVARGLLESWKRNNAITLALLAGTPLKGLGAVPHGSRGRTVAEQFLHVHQVREGWQHYHRTGQRPSKADFSGVGASKSALAKALKKSGKLVGSLLADALEGKARIRMFKGDPVRWYSYLVSHESHHRGQILLAL